jgi:DNA-binding response OmpR family regulator
VRRTVLVVEDDALIASSLGRALDVHGYEASVCGTVSEAVERIDADPPDLVLLDLGLPDGDGSNVATHVARHHPTIPVVMLTARGDEADVVVGLKSGAVDYVTKPFRLAELLARIGSQLRLNDARVERAVTARLLRIGDLVIDQSARRVTVDGRELTMRPKEFDLLARLARDAGRVVTREQLIDDVWDEHWWGSTKTLDVHVNAVRRKMGERAGEPSRIATIRGVGYRFEDALVDRR